MIIGGLQDAILSPIGLVRARRVRVCAAHRMCLNDRLVATKHSYKHSPAADSPLASQPSWVEEKEEVVRPASSPQLEQEALSTTTHQPLWPSQEQYLPIGAAIGVLLPDA